MKYKPILCYAKLVTSLMNVNFSLQGIDCFMRTKVLLLSVLLFVNVYFNSNVKTQVSAPKKYKARLSINDNAYVISIRMSTREHRSNKHSLI